MKLYATVTSERASKGQGGNKLVKIDVQAGDSREYVLKIVVLPPEDVDTLCAVGVTGGTYEVVRQLAESALECSERMLKGKKQKT